MQPSQLDELRALIVKHVVQSGAPLAAMPNVLLGYEADPTPPCVHVAEPLFSVIAQGTKQIEIGDRTFVYGPGQGMSVSIELPMNTFVLDGRRDAPFLGFALLLDAEAIASLLLEHGSRLVPAPAESSVLVSDVPDLLADSIIRLLRLLDSPADIPVLGPAMEREILWRLLGSPQGGALRQLGLADSHAARIGRALQWLRARYAEPVRIETLAEAAGMSETSFHRHFRQITEMTPVQYQKQLRLHAARARLMATAQSVDQIAFSVGYDSPSQFSREYRRQYGRSPGRDGRALRSAEASQQPVP
ncbi:AraC family transcriptional regulator [Caulobacter sp. D4A]|uniref:AraC family transcriptional regulator n=1 Tax=unclassified Caulobacter TaxID=2648921 RepID=UPI000D7294CE|nr:MULTISPECIES: AraC family transcriptional regulator [unclassified Caulobacter]PXA88849.1 AraC family transcriptional regulator [Caulobacter sp. D5]PXA94821.1 AraC family transcriptional regulator [Caulobacter sp. D4A]